MEFHLLYLYFSWMEFLPVGKIVILFDFL